jgi:hypothetical protein
VRRARYKVNLKGFMADCEANYCRLAKLFPDMAAQDERRLGISGRHQLEVLFAVRERSAHTTLLTLRQQEPGRSWWLNLPPLVVRIYHDARLAEVVACEGERNIWPRQSYPNRRMLQPDEKAQWNRFLGEWLGACLALGFVAADCPVP